METLKEVLIYVGITALLIPFCCMCLRELKDTIDYLKGYDDEKEN